MKSKVKYLKIEVYDSSGDNYLLRSFLMISFSFPKTTKKYRRPTIETILMPKPGMRNFSGKYLTETFFHCVPSSEYPFRKIFTIFGFTYPVSVCLCQRAVNVSDICKIPSPAVPSIIRFIGFFLVTFISR